MKKNKMVFGCKESSKTDMKVILNLRRKTNKKDKFKFIQLN